ncbi:MAG: prephenate dehydrogenase/arogenate dehydrogenase family protein [Armatimonadetes bacterium]|nr:prephenate dehydrogenase/arogenate dehydrogenase family protein [Armatimonadota bacterium]
MFERVAILGVGLIGGSFGLALRARGLAGEVVAYSRTPATRESAVALGAATHSADSPQACVEGADLVYLATPVDAVLPTLHALLPHLRPGCLVTDAASSKGLIVAAADSLDLGLARFVGGHPMTGKASTGVEAADADLFVDRAYAFTPTAHTDPAALARMVALAEAIGSRVLTLTPAEHDSAVATVSHLPHVLAYSLVLLTEQRRAAGEPVFELAAGSWESLTRVAASTPSLWREILLSNRDAVVAALSDYQKTVSQLTDLLAAGDGPALEALLAAAQVCKADHPGRGAR